MTRNEKMQKLMTIISTLFNLNGSMPTLAELKKALGSEYADVLAEYSTKNGFIPCIA